MGDAYPITPVEVPAVKTKNRTICSAIPHPKMVPLLEGLRKTEPWCMEGQPPIVWDRAQGFNVFDAYGNQWIDFSSGVLIANAGHGRQEMTDAICATAKRPLLTTYCFPHDIRAELVSLIHKQA